MKVTRTKNFNFPCSRYSFFQMVRHIVLLMPHSQILSIRSFLFEVGKVNLPFLVISNLKFFIRGRGWVGGAWVGLGHIKSEGGMGWGALQYGTPGCLVFHFNLKKHLESKKPQQTPLHFF